MKGVFDVKPGSQYQDRLAEWYHFPKHSHYLEVANAVRGDWILYRETKRDGGRKGYIGAAFVTAVEDAEPGFAYAKVERFFEFDPPIPLKDQHGHYREALLRAVPDPRLVGRTIEGKSLRSVSDEDFAAVVAEALGETLSPQNLVRYGPRSEDGQPEIIISEDMAPEDSFVRRVEATLVNRKVRSTNFRKRVCQAYGDTCAVTGLRIINGGGRSEVQAAHIWSVESGGPDTIQNGLALSGTVHWLFDRHLISLSPDYRLLVADNRIPQELRGLFPDSMSTILLPQDRSLWPHPGYLQRHRDLFAGH